MMRRLAFLFMAAAAACAPKAEDVPSTRADSATVVDSVRADSVRRDSLRADSVRVRGDTIPTVRARSRPDSIIGRDSAFGPTFTIDAKGKVTPIKKP